MTHQHPESEEQLRITPPADPLDAEVQERLQRELAACPDVAFAHLVDILVPQQQAEASTTVTVWVRSEAVRSIRQALNLVAAAVARALPDKQYLDVVILNSAPELLEQVEAADSLLVVNDKEERQHALQAMHSPPEEQPPPERPTSPWWWPF